MKFQCGYKPWISAARNTAMYSEKIIRIAKCDNYPCIDRVVLGRYSTQNNNDNPNSQDSLKRYQRPSTPAIQTAQASAISNPCVTVR